MIQKTKFLNRNVNTIFIMLGHECNLNCRYCLQHPLVEGHISHEINKDIYDFIEEVCSERDSDDKLLHLQFFGGEPLVFWENIKEIVTELNKRNLPIAYSLMTNGKLITEDKAEFMRKNHFWVAVSWDGFNTVKSRGFNPFEKGSKQREILLKYPDLGVSAVMCNNAYPMEICEAFQWLDDDYVKIHNHHLYMNVDEIMDTGNMPKDLMNIDFDRIKGENKAMVLEFLEDFKNGDVPNSHYARNVYITDMYNRVKNFYNSDVKDEEYRYNGMICCCGNGYTTLNMGIDGNLYPCHNTDMKAGTIYDSYFKYLRNIIKTDDTRSRRDECKNCEAIAFCGGGCKMIPKENRELYCKIKRAVFTPLIRILQRYGEGINKDDSVNNEK